jgi:hypothetical protein
VPVLNNGRIIIQKVENITTITTLFDEVNPLGGFTSGCYIIGTTIYILESPTSTSQTISNVQVINFSDQNFLTIASSIRFSASGSRGDYITGNPGLTQIYVGNVNGTINAYSMYGVNHPLLFTTYNTPIGTYLSTIPAPTGLYSWTQITVTPATPAISLAIDTGKSNKFYVTGQDNNVFSAVLSGGTLTINPTVLGTGFSSVNTVPITNTYNDTAYCYNLTQGQSQVGSGFNVLNKQITSVSGNAISNGGTGEFVIGIAQYGAVSLPPSTFTGQLWQSLGLNFGSIYVKDGDDTFAGNAKVWTYSVLINAINAAFAVAHTRLIANGGTITSIPTLTLNIPTGFATLNYTSDYTDVGNAILFNKRLHQLVYFEATRDTIDADYYNNILLSGSTSLLQTVLSLWQFNQLDKIIFQSNVLFFLGANGFAQNQSSNLFADFDVPISEPGYNMNNISNVLSIQPNFLNPLVLSSTEPVSRIQVQVLYQLQDGTQFPLYIPYGQNFSCKIIFNKRF